MKWLDNIHHMVYGDGRAAERILQVLIYRAQKRG